MVQGAWRVHDLREPDTPVIPREPRRLRDLMLTCSGA